MRLAFLVLEYANVGFWERKAIKSFTQVSHVNYNNN